MARFVLCNIAGSPSKPHPPDRFMNDRGTFRVMLIDRNPRRAAGLERALEEQGYEVVCRLDRVADLEVEVERARPEIIIVDMESPDRDTLEHLAALSRRALKPLLMFAEESDRDTIQAAVRAGVSAYIVDGFSHRRLRAVMDLAIARFREYQALRQELEEAYAKLADRKDTERAKGILMARRGLDEDAAYRLLRKMAMDRNKKIGEVARSLLSAVDLLG